MAHLLSQMASSSFSSPSSSAAGRVKHDVFLSFRGEDTRNNFTAHLHAALHHEGIQVFIDNYQLIKGEEISPSLSLAIQESKISIVVFSTNYASSTWSLDELVMIMKCRESHGQLVWPIFFNVEPSQVRNHSGSFGEALAVFEANPSQKYKEKLPEWKIALSKAGNLSGWHLTNGDESLLIQRIVEAVLRKLDRTPLYVAKYLVGIEARLENLGSLISRGGSDVRMIGIYGIGGIGKTTIAKAAFNKFADEFEGSSFLANVRETSKQYCGLVQLQETILFDMFGDRNLKVGNTHRGSNIIRYRLSCKRVLIVLDDVDQLDQLETLAGGHDWFGSGSRILITTRYRHFLTTHGVDLTYQVEGLNDYEALELLTWNAFKGDKPIEDYYELSKRVVGYANGLPLALVVTGSFLCGRSKLEWTSAIDNLERKPHKQVYGVLKLSYDALQDDEKSVFLDIACFFVGEDEDYIIKLLEGSNFCPTIGIGVLTDMSLISIESGKVRMHHLIQEMGRQIVLQESPEVGKRSRLWLPADVFHVFLENMGTNAIEGIKLELPEPKTLYLSAKAFKKMKRLRLLIFHNVVLSTTIEYLPTGLRSIDWHGYKLPTLPLCSGPKQLVRLSMLHSNIQQLGEGFKNFENLKLVNLSSSKFLTKIPDLSTAPNLESLSLSYCTNLVEIHESVGSLNRLSTLDLRFCSNLKIPPSSLRSIFLKTLDLTGCSSLESFPKIVVKMKNLKKLGLSRTAIKELSGLSTTPKLESLDLDHCTNLVLIHESVGFLNNRLSTLDLQFCPNLITLPSSLLTGYLETLNLTGCSSLESIPNIVVEMKNLKRLSFSGTAIRELPSSIGNLVSLQILNFASCNKLEHVPNSIYKLHQLEHLGLGGCSKLSKFPKSIFFSNSDEMFPSHELLPHVIQIAPDRSLKLPFPMLKSLDLQNCNLSEVDFLVTSNGFNNLEELNLAENKFVSLPSISRLSKLWYLDLKNCEFLQEIPQLPGNVAFLFASGCKSLNTHKNAMANIILNKKRSEIQVILSGHDIPHWFSNKLEQHSITTSLGGSHKWCFTSNFIVHSNKFKTVKGIILCAVFEFDFVGVTFSLHLDTGHTSYLFHALTFDSNKHKNLNPRTFISVKSGHMWLHYIPGDFICLSELPLGIHYRYKITFSAILETRTENVISKCGIHILWDEDKIKVACPFQNSGSQLSKRSFGVYNTYEDSESCWFPQQKRYCEPLRIKETVTDQNMKQKQSTKIQPTMESLSTTKDKGKGLANTHRRKE